MTLSFCQAGQTLSILVIRVEHRNFRRARPSSFEQSLFCCEIIFKRFVIIHMLARQVRKNRGGKMATPQAVHRQRVRTRFEHRKLPTRIANLRKKALQVHRFRRGVRRGIFAERRVISDRSEKAGFCAGSLHDGIHQRSRRGFPIRTGHRHQLQRIRRMPEKVCRCDGERFARFTHLNPGYARRNIAGAGASLAITAAPRETASCRKVFPSAFAPCNAKNRARGFTLRESQATCRISSSCAAEGIFASCRADTSRSFRLRGETRPGDGLPGLHRWAAFWTHCCLLVGSIQSHPNS